jgi:3-oxoacyl-(acyl-carrier-protein) synthase
MNGLKEKKLVHGSRVVITGLGVLAPNGCGKEAFWQACLEGRSGVRLITRIVANDLPTRIAGEIDFSPAAFGLTPVECGFLDRGTQLAVAAANLALDDAGLGSARLQDSERESIGVFMGTAMASVQAGECLWGQLTDYGAHPPRVPPQGIEPSAFMLSFMPSAVIAAHHSLRGPCLTFGTGCSAGADAIGQAFWQIQEGHAERMLAGGSDSALCRGGFSVFSSMHALSTHNEEPERASRPYEARRDGFVLSEGAAVLLLENRELALARGAHIYAEIRTYVTNNNAHHMAKLPEDGAPLQALLRQALEASHLLPEQLGYINSHGSSTPSNDVTETVAYKRVFGAHAYQIPISSTKSLIGHTQGAASAIELLVTALTLDRQVLAPTINLEVPDPSCDLDYIPNVARSVDTYRPLQFALSHSSGFGGVNTALVLSGNDTPDEVNAVSSPCQSHKQEWRQTAPLRRRVVITGLGVVAPSGIGKTAFWKSVCAGRRVIGPPGRYIDLELPAQYVGEVKDFHAEDYIDRKLARRTDRMTHFAFAAVQEALRDAGLALEQEDPLRTGAVIANMIAGVGYVTEQFKRLYQLGPHFMSARTALAWLPVANVGRVCVHYGLQGYCKVPINSTCGGLDALGQAYQAIMRDAADVLIAGGTEAPLHPCVLHILDASPPFHGRADPSSYRPFDLRADGLVIAEGAGICILEEYQHAIQRGASIYGEIVGYAQTCAPGDLTPHALPDVAAYIRALDLALTEAQMPAKDVACVFPDGSAIPAWDAMETAALREVFGSALDTLPCSVPRTQFGHTLSAAGALDTICALLALQEHLLPPTINCETPNPPHCPPGLVRESKAGTRCPSTGGLICARGLGGSHVVLALKGMSPS